MEKEEKKVRNPHGIMCIVGGFILCLSFASDFSYPNINTYLISYMRRNGLNPGLTYADFVFLTASKQVIQGASMPFIGVLAQKVGVRASIAIGSFIYSTGFILCFWAVDGSFVLAVLSLSLHGIGFSWVYATAIGSAQSWFPARRKGLVASLVVSGYGFGSLIWIPLQTAFVNPYNVKAQIDPECEYFGTQMEVGSCDRYFEDPDLLQNVPYMFLLLGCIFLGLGFISVFLISKSGLGSSALSTDGEDDTSCHLRRPQEGDSSCHLLNLVGAEEETNDPKEETPYSLTPTKVLQTSVFYQIWLAFFALTMTNGLMGTYSKSLGLTLINDDHYHAGIGVVSNVFNGVCRVVWGLIYDRLNFKRTFLIMGSLVTVFSSALPLLRYLEPESDEVKGLYGLVLVVLYASSPGIYAVVAAAVADAFGPSHYQANFGLMFSSSVAYCLFILVLTKVPAVYDLLGYTGMFLTAGSIGVIGLFIVACCTPTLLTSEQYRTKPVQPS